MTDTTTRTNITESKKIRSKSNIVDRRISYNILKRTVDIFVGILGIILLIPITLVVVIMRLIKHENQGPIFYEQLRIGKNGKTFRFYKYRTMCMNADEKLKEYLDSNEEAKKEFKEYKKLKRDPRITKVGRILRKTSLDEFPQFINILLGNMSLVGPRPYLPREMEDLGEYYNIITKCKPGITGYWQVNGRSNTSFEKRLEMDTYYINHSSIVFDIKIILRTIKNMIMQDGAI